MIVAGIDPGKIHTGWAVLTPCEILGCGMWSLNVDLTRGCGQFRRYVQDLLNRFHPDRLAIEAWVWEGAHTDSSEATVGLVCIARSFCEQVLVEVIPPREWSEAIVGHRPSGMAHGWSKPSWKRSIRAAVLLQLQARGIRDGAALLGEDPGNHATDATGLSLYSLDQAQLRQRVAVSAGRR